ncbi:3-hydroxyacyl-CoA dehydrogenase NAD-binding domain-containing protein [Priestia abyssalis]|uniref:3-hydroxyacyl-CoA dehydrogenase NAD-binding domain-containing protein n=1 Tax=Priestia abyssalis TaxID=1221450 RepID=UPI0009952332|nr:3-hydroxyacyl-CoA dehydrogenase NAD-binding domain-containing protein [Priestia abyssalis]
MSITTVGVVGSGTMGAGIAQVVAQSGFHVLLFDMNEEIVSRSLSGIMGRLERLVEKGKLSKNELEEIRKRIQTSTHLCELKSCHLVIEAASEKIGIKKEIFQKLDEHCSAETILVTNTSSFSITEIASITRRPERVAGMHFFNPVPLMPLVEVIRGVETADEIIENLVQFASGLQKVPVTCEDTPGFIVNRVARPYYNEALKIYGERLAAFDQIDRIMKKAGKFKMGPFELQDLIGIDINFSTTESVYQGFFGEGRFRPHFYQQRMMQSGKLGRKVGAGYYHYEN